MTMWFDCYSVGLNGDPIRIDKEPRQGWDRRKRSQPRTPPESSP
jgi:hypothetical protein